MTDSNDTFGPGYLRIIKNSDLEREAYELAERALQFGVGDAQFAAAREYERKGELNYADIHTAGNAQYGHPDDDLVLLVRFKLSADVVPAREFIELAAQVRKNEDDALRLKRAAEIDAQIAALQEQRNAL